MMSPERKSHPANGQCQHARRLVAAAFRVDARTKTCGPSDDQGHGNHTKGNKDWFWCLLRPRCSPHQPSETALSEIGLKRLTIGAAKGSKHCLRRLSGETFTSF